jgi:hypothetical protein
MWCVAVSPQDREGAYEDAVSLVYRLVREHASRTNETVVPYSVIQELTKRHNVTVRRARDTRRS